MTHAVEPTGRDDEWTWQVVRLSDGCVVGWYRTEQRAQAVAENGGEPPTPAAEERPRAEAVDQLELFGAAV